VKVNGTVALTGSTRVRWQAALPQIMVGLKTAMPLAVIGTLVGELFAAIALLALMSIALFYALVLLENRLVPWVRHTTA